MTTATTTSRSTPNLPRSITAFRIVDQESRLLPHVSLEVVVNLIAGTTTDKGLKLKAALDTGKYPSGIKVDNETMAELHIDPDKFRGDWNYSVVPQRSRNDRRLPRTNKVLIVNAISWQCMNSLVKTLDK